jgi:hypothetical protein
MKVVVISKNEAGEEKSFHQFIIFKNWIAPKGFEQI